MPVQVRNGV